MNQQQDIDTIKKTLDGELAAFEALVTKYQATLLALAWNMMGDRDEACDVIQETFLQAYTNLERFDISRNFKTWLFSIAAKRCIDRLRKNRSFLKYFNFRSKEIKENNHRLEPFTPIEQSETFLPILKSLNPKERIAICLKTNEDYSAAEIAKVIACSEATARVHLFNARRKLKETLIELGKKSPPKLPRGKKTLHPKEEKKQKRRCTHEL